SLDLTVLGLCADASLSSVGCSLVRYRQDSLEGLLHMEFLLYDETAMTLQVQSPIFILLRSHPMDPHIMLRAHKNLGHMLATAFHCFCKNHSVVSESIDLISLRADPISGSMLSSLYRTTVKDPQFRSWIAVVASETEITTIANSQMMRRRSSQPESPAEVSIDSRLLQDPTKYRVCVTISDLVSIALIPPSKSSTPYTLPKFASADCGPGTNFINYAMRYASSNQNENDRDGSYGAGGTINHSVVDCFLSAHDYFVCAPPMNIAFEMFGQHEAQFIIDDCLSLGMSDADTVATITRIIAQNIVLQYRRLVSTFCLERRVDEMFICGPGANNMNITSHLNTVMPDVEKKLLDDIGIPGDAKDSVRCAQLGLEEVLRCAVDDRPAETEKERPELLENIIKGKRWEDTKEQIMRFSGGKEIPPVGRVVVEREY
ncbi:hypothetical protein DM02DRAFT_473075, partial [Periconia macrospinosa]